MVRDRRSAKRKAESTSVAAADRPIKEAQRAAPVVDLGLDGVPVALCDEEVAASSAGSTPVAEKANLDSAKRPTAKDAGVYL